MRTLRDTLNKQYDLLFKTGRPLERFSPIYEAMDTFLFTPGKVTRGAAHVRDGLDLKRMMITVVVALAPCMFWAMFNTGHQAALTVEGGATPSSSWQASLFHAMGWGHDHTSVVGSLFFGALFYIPIYLVTLAAGGLIEVLIAVIRKREISEGFLVTGALFALTLPPAVPLWQAALGIVFGVLFGKAAFAGLGRVLLNPALVGRAFLFFAFPGQMSGGALVGLAKTSGTEAYSWMDAFLGLIPGSIGATSTLFCLLGAAVLLLSGVGPWRTMAGCVAGVIFWALFFNAIGSKTNPMFAVPFWWHFVGGGFAFGTVFMATDPMSSAFTNTGKLIYGFGIGTMLLFIRVANPDFPEGMMFSILAMNLFAPLIDYILIETNVRRRRKRYPRDLAL